MTPEGPDAADDAGSSVEASGIRVTCVLCGYETMLFEAESLDDGRACPYCGEDESIALDAVFKDHPVPIVDGEPGLVRLDEATEQLREDLPVILDLADKHGLVD